MSNVVFRYCDMYRETLVEKARAYPGIGLKVQDFKKFKSENPLQAFGTRDKPFMGNQVYGTTIKDLRHAHFNLDLMIVYTISGRDPTVFDLYGIFSHDELGIGQPANIRKQRSMATRMANQTFGGKEPEVSADAEPGSKFTATKTGKVDYTPKKKAEPTPAQQTKQKIDNPVPEFVRVIDSAWPKQNFANRFNNAAGLQDKLAVINQEAHYINRIKQSVGKLYPNQMDYARGLQILANYLVDQQRQKK